MAEADGGLNDRQISASMVKYPKQPTQAAGNTVPLAIPLFFGRVTWHMLSRLGYGIANKERMFSLRTERVVCEGIGIAGL